MIRGLRGAITVGRNEEAEIQAATERLLRKMIESNRISPDLVASVFISATHDLTAGFPARALRELNGWKYVPVMCMQEMAVTESLKMCVRVMMHINTEKGQKQLKHIYLEGAKVLRPDLNEEE
ncbi:chorismate mutase [Neobacillus terrae]|uniref:chorismate mutase n=1 Tax=Neobacillus terrae TaxID=3034837 RepID=UPI001407860E|nr:chorismate mutase [Neobacillus terrae]NHM29128.1 chorismate mutase [Neobacillus terrae]